MTTNKVTTFKKKPDGSMPSFIEPAFSRQGDEVVPGFFISNPFCRDTTFFVTKENLAAIAAWVNAGGLEE